MWYFWWKRTKHLFHQPLFVWQDCHVTISFCLHDNTVTITIQDVLELTCWCEPPLWVFLQSRVSCSRGDSEVMRTQPPKVCAGGFNVLPNGWLPVQPLAQFFPRMLCVKSRICCMRACYTRFGATKLPNMGKMRPLHRVYFIYKMKVRHEKLLHREL